MNNELVNEIASAREDKLFNLNNHVITVMVREALEIVSPGAINGLQGLSADNDGVTRKLWLRAVTSAGMTGALVFPQYMDDSGIPADAEPVSYDVAEKVIAGRVARAILHVNGYIRPYDEAEPGSYGPDNQDRSWYDR